MAEDQRRRKARKQKRTRHSGLYTVISAVLILAAVVAACTVFFRVDDVVVQGNRRYTAQEIIDVAGVKTGDNLFALRSAKLSRELRGRLPYIRTVSVRRMLPDTLVITVTEGSAVAAVAYEGAWWLMDADGKLLEQTASPGGVSVVTGITPLAPAVGTYLAAGEEHSDRVERLKELLGALSENGLADKLEGIDLTEDYQVSFEYASRFSVHLSSTTEKGMAYWLRRFKVALDDPKVDANQSYSVEIMDEETLHFIPK